MGTFMHANKKNVELVRTTSKSRLIVDMNNVVKIEVYGKKKEEGNTLFKLGKYARASKRYEKAAKFIEYDSPFSEEEKTQSKVLKVSCNLKNAACKLKDCKAAEKLCTKVLEIASRNVKALYRRAQVSTLLFDLELAEQVLYRRVQLQHHCATPMDLYIA